MSETVSFGGSSIKFYEQLSTFQGQLRGYDSQSFVAEQEVARLREKSRELTLSQQSSNLEEDNNRGGRERQARNQAILDKLQELETNASIFAARSERLRMMTAEYENLVRKYTANKNLRHQHQHNVTHKRTTTTSCGVNTNISGPIGSKPISHDNTTQTEDQDSLETVFKPKTVPVNNLKNVLSFPDFEPNPLEILPLRKPTFPDISSTSEESNENVLQAPKDPVSTNDTTTSLSALLPKSNYTLEHNISSLSVDSTSQVKLKPQAPQIQKPMQMKRVINEQVEIDVDEDSTAHSVGDSMMDSICNNKTPDSLPQDNSELVKISEATDEDVADEEQNNNHEKRNQSSFSVIKKPEQDESREIENPIPTQNLNDGGSMPFYDTKESNAQTQKVLPVPQKEQESKIESRERKASISSPEQKRSSFKGRTKPGAEGNKKVHIKLDYDDSESESFSEKEKNAKKGERNKAFDHRDPKSSSVPTQKELDDEFADFFD